MPELRLEGPVHVLDLGDGENRVTPDWLDSVNALLDTVSASPGPRAVVTVARGKFWSNGLDVAWMVANGDGVPALLRGVHDLLARVLTFPAPTVAAISGHAFGVGAMLAMAHDWRVMRADRGYLCFPEADIRMPFSPGMAALIQAKLTPAAARDAMLTARRYPGPEAEAAGLVDVTADEDAVVAKAVEIAAGLADKDPGTLGSIKATAHAATAAVLLAADQLPAGPTR